MKKFVPYVIASLLLLVIVFIAGRCSRKALLNQQVSNIIAARDSVKTSYVTIDGLKNSVYEKNAIILGQNDAIKAGVLENTRLKALHLSDLQSNTDLSGTIRILRDSLKLPPQTIFITVKDTSGVTHDYVRVPFTLLNVTDKYLTLKAGMNLNRTAFYDLSVPFSGTISIGYVGSGFLNLKKTPKGVFTTENPYIKINDMDVLMIQEQKTLLQKTWFHMLVGGVIVEGLNIYLKK